MTNLGCDIVYMPRLEKHLEDMHWIRKILTESEVQQFLNLTHPRRRLEYFSGRFAAKEAYSKAMGTGIGHVSFQDFEVLSSKEGAPIASKGCVSISHDHNYAMAVVLL